MFDNLLQDLDAVPQSRIQVMNLSGRQERMIMVVLQMNATSDKISPTFSSVNMTDYVRLLLIEGNHNMFSEESFQSIFNLEPFTHYLNDGPPVACK